MTTDTRDSPSDEAALRGEWGQGPYSATRRGHARPRPWYKRRAALLAGGVVACVVVAIVLDFPTPASRTSKIATTKTFVTEGYGYLKSCNAGLAETFKVAADVAKGNLSSRDLATAKNLVSQDHLACSLANNYIFELASLDVPRTVDGTGQLASSLFSWAVPDAYGATGAIATLVSHPRDPGASALLRHFADRLTADRASAASALRSMDVGLGTKFPPIPLAKVPPGPLPLTASS